MEKTIQSNKTVRLGLFVSASLALLLIAIFIIGNKQHLFSKTFTLNAHFKDAAGLQEGNNVRYSGINIGTVKRIEIVGDNRVKVNMIIDEETRKFIRKDSKALIGSDGLMGSKVLNITTGSPQSPIVKNNDVIESTRLAGLDDIMAKMDTVAGHAIYITSDVKGIMNGLNSGNGTLGKLLKDDAIAHSVDKTINSVNTTVGTLNTDLEALQSSIFLRKGIKKKEAEEKALLEQSNPDTTKKKKSK